MGKIQIIESIARYFVKPGKSILVHTKPGLMENFSCAIKDGTLSQENLANLGDACIFTESLLKKQFNAAKSQVENIFGHLSSVKEVYGRPKSALSIHAKQEKALQKASFTSIQDAVSVIKDGIGTRVITKSLPKLGKKEIEKMITSMEIDGKKLTKGQIKLLRDYIYERPIKSSRRDEALRLFEEFARPLVEKRSKEVVDELTLGILKHNIETYGVSLEELSTSGLFREDLMKRLLTEKITPINVTEINNYRGQYGLPEFSNNQIRQLTKAMSYGNPKGSASLKIVSDPRSLDYCRFPEETLRELSNKSIKSSGYRTAQINIVHENGALGEIQFRGARTSRRADYEHDRYDALKNKNTLEEFDEIIQVKKALQDSDEKQMQIHNEHMEAWFNYDNRIELGLPAKRPKKPKSIPRIMSMESLERIHLKNHLIKKEQELGFERYYAIA